MTNQTSESSLKLATPIMISMRKNIFTASWYQLVYLAFFIGLPFGILALQIDTLEIFMLPINLSNMWVLWIIGFGGLGFLIVQWVYVIILPKYNGSRKIFFLGKIVGIFMLFFLPTGTFFGALLLLNLQNNNVPPKTTVSPTEKQHLIGKNIAMAGILMLNLPMILLCLQFYFLTLQIDILYPILSTKVLYGLSLFCYLYIGLFIAQAIVGILYPRFASKSWMRIILWFFVLLQIFSLGIVFEAFFIYLVPNSAEFEDLARIIYFVPLIGWVIGVLLNPLGVYFGGMMAKTLKNASHLKENKVV